MNVMKNFGIRQALNYLEKDPEENIPKGREVAEKIYERHRFFTE